MEGRGKSRSRLRSRDMKTVSAETRKAVQKRHLEKLETDDHGLQDEWGHGDVAFVISDGEEVEDYNEVKNKKRKKLDPVVNDDRSKKRWKSFEQILVMEGIDRQGIDDDEFSEPNYCTAVSSPSVFPPRSFCSVCGFPSSYKCTRCGEKFCSTSCNKVHAETRCLKFTA